MRELGDLVSNVVVCLTAVRPQKGFTAVVGGCLAVAVAVGDDETCRHMEEPCTCRGSQTLCPWYRGGRILAVQAPGAVPCASALGR